MDTRIIRNAGIGIALVASALFGAVALSPVVASGCELESVINYPDGSTQTVCLDGGLTTPPGSPTGVDAETGDPILAPTPPAEETALPDGTIVVDGAEDSVPVLSCPTTGCQFTIQFTDEAGEVTSTMLLQLVEPEPTPTE